MTSQLVPHPSSNTTPPTPECHVEVRPSPTSGNGLFATKDIPAGSTILLKPRPLIGELDLPRLAESCHNCFLWSGCVIEGGEIEIKACTGCKKVKYCSKACQKQAWTRYHKQECKLLKDPSLPPIPSSVRAALQLAFLMDSNAVSEEDKAGLLRLEAHDASTLEQVEARMQYEVTSTAASDLYARTGNDTSKIRAYVGKILRNSLTLTSPVLDPMGIALDPTVCSANHSCEPNASVLFDQPYLMMRSLSSIQKGEEVFISYIDNTDPSHRRQTQLKQRYCFECQCSKCQYGTNGREDDWAQRIEKLASKWSSLAEDIDSKANFSADPAAYVGESKAEKDLSILQGWIYHDYEPIRNQQDDTLATEALENVMRTCKQTEMWPITRQPYANIRVDITSRMLSQNRLGLALFQMAKTYFLIDPILYPQDFHPVRVVHTWNLAKTLVQAYSSPNDPSATVDAGVEELFCREFDFVVPIVKLLKKLVGDVVKSHGEGSKLAMMVFSMAKQVFEGVGEQNLREIDRDPLGMWGEFERWADYLEY